MRTARTAPKRPQLSTREFIVLSLTLAVLYQSTLLAESARIRLGPTEEEPTSRKAYTNYRVVFADPNYYHLKQAGALKEENIGRVLIDDIKTDERGNFEKVTFEFNSSEYIRKDLSARWFYLLEERIALHVYDDQNEMDLSTGPQVNQELCGLHLDYMVHMIEKHLKRIDQSTEYSLYKLMQAYDSPRQGLGHGSSVFAGDYDTCTTYKLNVVRRELEKVNKTSSEKYFSDKLPANGGKGSGSSSVKSLLCDLWHTYLKPFFGFYIPDSVKSISISGEQVDDKLKLLPMRYCMAGLRWPGWSNTSWARRHIALRTGACLPETCDSNSLQLHYDKIRKLVEFQLTKFHDKFYIQNLYCLPDEQSKFRNPFEYTSTVLFLAFNLVWLLLLISSTLVYHFAYRDSARKRRPYGYKSWWLWLRCWCVTRNARNFLSAGASVDAKAKAKEHSSQQQQQHTSDTVQTDHVEPINKLDLAPLEGFKVLSSLSVMTSHSVMVVLSATWNFDKTRHLLSNTWLVLVFTVCPAIVDNFFNLTGAIMARSLLKTSRQHFKSPAFWLKFCAYRYMRIIPLYLLSNWFLQTAFRFLGSGPFWDYGTSHSSWSKSCQSESLLWRVILPTANFVSPSVHCEGVGWYLANDLQFTLLACLLMPLLLYKPIVGHLVNLTLILIGVCEHVRYFYVYDPDPRGLFEWSSLIMTRVTDDTMTGYVSPQYRFVAFLAGLSVGQLMDAYERGNIARWPRWFAILGKISIFLVIYVQWFAPSISSLILDISEHNIRLISAIFQGTAHLLASIASSVFILLLTSGQHFRPLGRFMSARVFHPMANMALSTMLVHIPIMFYQNQILRALPHLTAARFYETNLIYIVESFLAAAIVHVLYELPLRNVLIKALFTIFAGRSVAGPTKSTTARDDKVGTRRTSTSKIKAQ